MSPTTFDLQPRLVGRLVELRPLAPADFDDLHRAASDPVIWEQHPEPDRWKRPVFQKYFDGGIASGGALVILDHANGRIIGSSRYCHLDPDASEVEIGWTFLERAYWGGATNGELKALMIDHAFRFVRRVVFVVGENNWRSRKAVEKIGGRLVRTLAAAEPGGTPGAKVVFAIDRERWSQGPR